MGEIRFVGTGETRGYPYLVCKKNTYNICPPIVDLPASVMEGIRSFIKLFL